MEKYMPGQTETSRVENSASSILASNSTEMYLELLKKILINIIYEDDSYIPEWDNEKQILVYKEHPYDVNRRLVGQDIPTRAHTMIGKQRLDSLHDMMERVHEDQVPGDFIETGVWRGGTCIFMAGFLRAYKITDRAVWVADSFKGFPESDNSSHSFDRKIALDKSEAKHRALPVEIVQEYFKRYDLLSSNIKFLEGWFNDTLPTAPINELAILRLDGDLYESTMDSLVNLYPKLSVGGFVIIDDFGWEGCRDAVEEFRAQNAIAARIRFEGDNRGYAYWRREA